MGGNSGGSASQTVPGYIQAIHSHMVWGYDHEARLSTNGVYDKDGNQADYTDISMLSNIRSLFTTGQPNSPTTNPYYEDGGQRKDQAGTVDNALDPYDPDTDLDAIDTKLGAFSNMVALLTNTTDQVSRVDDMEDALTPAYYRFTDRLVSSYIAGGSVNNVGFLNALVLRGHLHDLSRELYGSEIALAGKHSQIDLARSLASATISAKGFRIISKTDELEQDIDYASRYQLWAFESRRMFANVLGSPAGSVIGDSSQHRNRAASALSGAFSGASIGTSINPGIGTAVGAVVGGIGGLLTG